MLLVWTPTPPLRVAAAAAALCLVVPLRAVVVAPVRRRAAPSPCLSAVALLTVASVVALLLRLAGRLVALGDIRLSQVPTFSLPLLKTLMLSPATLAGLAL